MKVQEFNYQLPKDRIASTPTQVRGSSRLMVLNRHTSTIEHRKYADLVEYLGAGDVLVLNDTRVIKARLLAKDQAGTTYELIVLEKHANSIAQKALYRGKLSVGTELFVGSNRLEVADIQDGIATFNCDVSLVDLAKDHGSVPLPPYIHRAATAADEKRYQTVFAIQAGSVAAPTASLNITSELLEKLRAKGVIICYITLHVGLGTFLPIRVEDLGEHHMHSEWFEIPKSTVESIRLARNLKRKILCVGTTTARSLEYAAESILHTTATTTITGEADIFIYPGYKFKLVDALLTNFHAPKSTVLMLATAFAGKELLQRAYQDALAQDYWFLSYGDSMLLL